MKYSLEKGLLKVQYQLKALEESCRETEIRVSNVTETNNVSAGLRRWLTCKICTIVPGDTIVLASCCGNVIGCGSCAEQWYSEQDDDSGHPCILCKGESADTKLVILKGLDDLQRLIN